jgi:hypothetical protein
MFMIRTRRVLWAVGEGSAPVGLEDGGEGSGHPSGLLGGQPGVGVGRGRDVRPLLGFLAFGRDEALRYCPAAVDERQGNGGRRGPEGSDRFGSA